MNPRMWLQPGDAAQRRAARRPTASSSSGRNAGEMAERGEAGPGRLAEVPEILAARRGDPREGASCAGRRVARDGSLAGRHVLVTSGPTHEPIDPVRYIANRSSGKQGHAIAAAAAALGARVTLVSGPGRACPIPPASRCVHVETARGDAGGGARQPAGRYRRLRRGRRRLARGERRRARRSRRPARSARARAGREPRHPAPRSAKRGPSGRRSSSALLPRRETSSSNASKKRKSKGADWIVANDVSPETRHHGRRRATPCISSRPTASRTGRRMTKAEVARAPHARAAEHLGSCNGRSRMTDQTARDRAPRRTVVRRRAAGAWPGLAAAGLSVGGCRRDRPRSPRVDRTQPGDAGAGRARAGADRPRAGTAARATRRRCGRAPASRSSTASPCSTARARSTATIAARCASS